MKIRTLIVIAIIPFFTLSAQIKMGSDALYVRDDIFQTMILKEKSNEQIQDYFEEKISIDSLKQIRNDLFDIFTHSDVKNISLVLQNSSYTSTKDDPKLKYVKTLGFKTEPKLVTCKPNINIKLSKDNHILALELYNHYTNKNFHQYGIGKICSSNDSIKIGIKLNNGAKFKKEISNVDTLYNEILSVLNDIHNSKIEYAGDIVYPNDSLFAFSLVFSKMNIQYYVKTKVSQKIIKETDIDKYTSVKERKVYDEILSISFLRNNTNHLYISDQENISIIKIKKTKKFKNLIIDILNNHPSDFVIDKKYSNIK